MSEKVKLQCPENVNSVNVGGEQYNVDEDGCIKIDASVDYSMLLGAGFTIAKLSKKEEKAEKDGNK